MKKFLFGIFATICMAFSLVIVNVNTASSAELEASLGIGLAKTKTIAGYHQEDDAFKSVEELKNVRGISDAVLNGLKTEATVFSAASKAAQPAMEEQAGLCLYAALRPSRLSVGPGVALSRGGDEA